MRQIEKERLRPMNCFTKAADEFAHHNFLIKLWLKPKAPAYPDEKNRERGNPRPPTEPGATRLRFRRARRSCPTTAQLEQRNARQQKGINNRTFDQHRRGEQYKHVNLIARFPVASGSDFLPDQQADQKKHEREEHIAAQ